MAKQLFLKRLSIKNFKGIKDLSIPVQLITTINGDNATGKTTINDAATWLLFGKDSQGRSSFEVQPLDENGQVIHFLDTCVEAVLEHDGNEITLKRLLRENWQKPHGQPDSILKGTTTSYYIDEVPQKQKEYVAFINSLIDEKLFKLLTNPIMFESMNWKDKRALLFEMCGDVSDEDVVSSNKKLKDFLDILSGKSIDDFKKVVADKKRKLKEDIDKIPARIDELTGQLEEIDVGMYKSLIEQEQAKLDEIEGQLEASTKAFDDVKKKQQQIINYEQTISKLRLQATKDANNAEREKEYKLNTLKLDIESFNSSNTRLENDIKNLEIEKNDNAAEIANLSSIVDSLRKDWVVEDAKEFVFDSINKICPHCGQELPGDKLEEAKASANEYFEKTKANKLATITSTACDYNKKINSLIEKNTLIDENISSKRAKFNENTCKINELSTAIIELKDSIKIVNVEEIEDTEEIKLLNKSIEILQKEVNSAVSNDNSELKNRKLEVQSKIYDIKSIITKAEINEKTAARIEELKKEHEQMGELLSELEKQEFMVEEFTRTKVDMLEDKINSRFKYITFKLFDQQVNGGISECCESLINGVPFSNANNAAKINAGLDIINSLISFYGVSAPIFIDNAESVNELIHTDSQVIRLVVSHDEKLVIE